MKIILSLIIGGALVVSGFGQTRNVLVGTNNAVIQPTNFWSADAVNARAGLGLGSAATNPATAFQPSSLNLSNIAANNGGGLTNLNATSIVGVVSVAQGGTGATNASDARTALGLGTAATNPATAFQSSSTVLSNLATGNGGALSNLQSTNLVGLIPASNIPSVTFTNLAGTLAINQGGTGATNATDARQNLGVTTVGDAVFTATNATAARTAIGALASNDNGAGLTNLTAANITGTVGLASNVSGVVAIANGGSGATTAGGARTNLGLTWTGLTNPSASTFQAALFGANTNPVLVDTNGEVVSPTNFWQVAPITTTFIESQPTVNQTTNMPAGRNLHIHSLAISTVGVTNTIVLPTTGSFSGDIALVVHEGPTSSVTAVRQAGAGTNLITLNQFDEAVEFVFYNNVWQFNHNRSFIEPIYFSGTNAAANAAASVTNLFTPNAPLVYNTNGEVVANTGTNTLTLTNSVTFAGATFNGVVNMNSDLLVNFIEASDGNNDVIMASTGISFSGTAPANTRTNLGLGATWLTNDNVTNFRTAIGLGATNDVEFNQATFNGAVTFNEDVFASYIEVASETNSIEVFGSEIKFFGISAAATRTNLGLPLPALTETSNVTFQSAVFTTNTAPTNTANVNGVGFNTAVKWMEITLNISGTNQVFRIPLFQ
jgi:hypothetical protein